MRMLGLHSTFMITQTAPNQSKLLHHNSLLWHRPRGGPGVPLRVVNNFDSKSISDLADVVIVTLPQHALVLRMRTRATKL
jgi:hypothetical protein